MLLTNSYQASTELGVEYLFSAIKARQMDWGIITLIVKISASFPFAVIVLS